MFWLEGHEFLTGRQYVICGDASNQAEGMHSGMAMAEGWWSSSPILLTGGTLAASSLASRMMCIWHVKAVLFNRYWDDLQFCSWMLMFFSFMMMYIYRWILKSAAEGVDVCIFLLNSLVNCARTNSKWPSESSVATAPTWRQHLMLSRDRTKIFRSGKWSPWQGEIAL